MLALTVFNKWCFDVLYPTHRTVLMFYPLIAMVLVGFVNAVITKHKIKAIISYSVGVCYYHSFFNECKFHKTFDYWQQDRY
jgi:hypothetical protein